MFVKLVWYVGEDTGYYCAKEGFWLVDVGKIIQLLSRGMHHADQVF